MKLAKEDRTERENRIPETTTDGDGGDDDTFSSFGAPISKDDRLFSVHSPPMRDADVASSMFLMIVFVFVFDSWMLEAKCRM